MSGFGGTGKAVFFGLLRDRASDVNPSFLEQTPYKAQLSQLSPKLPVFGDGSSEAWRREA